jgi:hypothetical protein
MTPGEFLAWLDGYLDGKDGLTADQVVTLRTKAQSLNPLRPMLRTGDIGVVSTGAMTATAYDPFPRAYVNGRDAGPSD